MFFVYYKSKLVDCVVTLLQASEIKEKIADPGKVKIIFEK
jgi:hypothetical protein